MANDTIANQYQTADCIRAINGGFSPLPYQYMRFINGDTTIGFRQANDAGETTTSSFQVAEPGSLWVNAFRLSAGADFQMVVANGDAQTTRYYFPVFVRPLSQKDTPAPKQNIQTVSSTTAATVAESQQ